ncbi:photosynthetic complex putative assembly protein PuhB [Afifella marina]|uniref:PH domain-containing protein n=1 Tax=Afifella marina DSM 2698 TaxID=1120955 RepID=A0A1G5P0H1_AFIMA|nr:photosynthetic complex putative assembly protein PuhB [Afifella marina]MBK1624334.1 hypothetical protein [Afifella marina DSM 2698]MBK1628066.1 hypothetical protein [Afifella marina]MBK5918261.1 hypothetical protein [Afifella marina]RAI19295.1 hypothetical protein CH311_13430 [Afifella marina DSM 2698]SCZ43057.1 PH domain-containing protein [Afifella marina DSM 2698]
MNEYESEPIRGLPQRLPKGERILWQGEPRWASLARRLFHLPTLVVYFAVLLALRAILALSAGGTVKDAILSATWLLPVAALAVVILTVYGWLIARTSVYTITEKRLVIRSGVVLPMTLNIPFVAVESAALRLYGQGIGDIPLVLSPNHRVAYYALWPHARPWKIKQPEPMLRSVADAERVAEILAGALAATAGRGDQAGETAPEAETDTHAQWSSHATAVA